MNPTNTVATAGLTLSLVVATPAGKKDTAEVGPECPASRNVRHAVKQIVVGSGTRAKTFANWFPTGKILLGSPFLANHSVLFAER